MLRQTKQTKAPDYVREILGLIRGNLPPRAVRKRLLDYHANDIAGALGGMDAVDRRRLFLVLEPKALSEVFAYVDGEEETVQYLNELELKRRAETLANMDSDRLVTLLRKLAPRERADLLALMDDTSRREIAMINAFSEDEIGSRMSTNCVAIRDGLTVKQAMKSVIAQAAQHDNISTIYVLDQSGGYCGAIDLKDLIIAREGDALEALITSSFPYVYGWEPIDACIEKLKDYSEASIPILDDDNHLLGVLTSQDLIQLVDEELGEDYARLAGLTAEEDLREPVLESVKKRLPWLLVLLVLGLVVSSVVGAFESVVQRLTLVICFQSLILDMSGNVGTQSLAVTIRVLMDENLAARQRIALVGKEIRVGLVNGLLLGLLSFACIGGYIWLCKRSGVQFAFAVSGCIGAALVLSMVISSLTGTVIPILFKKLRVDPAVASGPLITTVNDLVAVVAYYGLAWLFLIELLHFG